ncbi:unnamed protein product [Rotaria magnacalcarata]|nr:unnamed protein product [Rotaria magnacalcarata]
MRPIIVQRRTEIQAETSKLTAICTQIRTDAQTETKRVAAVCNLLRTELSKSTLSCNQLRKTLNEIEQQLNEQNRFLCAFMNNGHPMSDLCINSISYCQVLNYNEDNQLVCSLCRSNISSMSISLHHCEGGCICKKCVENYCQEKAHNGRLLERRPSFQEVSHSVATSRDQQRSRNVSRNSRDPEHSNHLRTFHSVRNLSLTRSRRAD